MVMAALSQLAGEALRPRRGGGSLVGDVVQAFAPGVAPGLLGQRRARRRSALTAKDMAQAAQIASMISKKAAENFILSRTRGA